jgi:hypothetical protein
MYKKQMKYYLNNGVYLKSNKKAEAKLAQGPPPPFYSKNI